MGALVYSREGRLYLLSVIEVAKRAGLPKKVLERAQILLNSLENQKAYAQKKEDFKKASDQMTFFS